jgi:diacylglycerol O-acyltransferase / wax synthase
MDWCSASTADYDATPDVDELAAGIELGAARLLTPRALARKQTRTKQSRRPSRLVN